MASTDFPLDQLGPRTSAEAFETKPYTAFGGFVQVKTSPIEGSPQGSFTIDYILNIEEEDEPLGLAISSAFADNSFEKVLGYLVLRADPISATAERTLRQTANRRSSR